MQIFSIILVLNAHGAIARYYYEDKSDFANFLGLSVAIVTALLAFSAAGILIFQEVISKWLDLPISVIPYFIPAMALYVIMSIFRSVYMPRRNSQKIQRYDITQSYIGFALAVALVIIQKDELYLGRLKADVLILCIFGVLRIKDIWKYISFKIDFKHLRYILNFCLPNIPYLLSGVIISQFDRIMINSISGSKEAGLYSFAYNISMVQLMVSNAIHNAWTPKYYEYMNQKKYDIMDNESQIIGRLLTISVISLILFAREIGIILSSSNYHQALSLVPIILVGHYFVGLMPFNKNAILHAKKTYITAGITLSGGAINVLLNAMLIPQYGYTAAAYTTVASFLFIYIVEIIIAKYILKYHIYPITRMKLEALILLLSLSMYYFYFIERDGFIFIDIISKLLLIGSGVMILFWKNLQTIYKGYHK